jgi:putative ABC transport system permease protein
MSRYIALSLAQRRFALSLVGSFGLLAFVLASAGVYGITTFVAEQRRRDVAVRLALGATHAAVVRMMFTDVVGAAFAGIGVGFVVIAATSRTMSGVLVNVSPTDAEANSIVAALLLVGSAVAALPPLLRIVRVELALTLRGE